VKREEEGAKRIPASSQTTLPRSRKAWRAARAETAAAADDGPQAQADGQPAPTPDGAEAVPVRGDLAELPSPVPSPAPTPRPARAGAAGEARAASPGLPSPRQARRS
ncbi:unnamed protein product, partial [Prorocentrum cordatum]